MPELPQSYPRDLGLTKNLPAFLLGLLATSFQVLLLREFSAYLSGNELTLGIVLASWLLWVGLGSFVAGKRAAFPRLSSLYFLVVALFPFALLAVRFSRLLFRLSPGELVGLCPVIVLSLSLCLLIGFPLGALFVINVSRQTGDISRVYILESLGAVSAGPLVYGILALSASSRATTITTGAVVILSILLIDCQRPARIWALVSIGLLAGFWLADHPSQQAHWKPFELITTRDTRYSRLQLIRAGEQLTLYSNSAPIFSFPDPGAAEESVHFAMLQNPGARRVLLVGGGAGGALREILRYPEAQVDYLELDPEIIRLSRVYLGDQGKSDLASSRVRIILQDGRTFLQKTKATYEAILLNLPEPATAQVNRYYTREFFLLARRHLTPNGILSFAVQSSETAIGPELQQFLSSLFYSVSRVFREVGVVPGNRNIFLASDSPVILDAKELTRRLASIGLQTRYLEPRALQSRLHAFRIQNLKKGLEAGRYRLNSDLAPVSFFLNAFLWSAQFRGPAAAVLRFFSKVSVIGLLGLPLLLFGLVLFFLRQRKSATAFSLLPLAVMGLTTIVTEIVALVWFQSLYGYLYGRIALLLSTFMLGLFLGALAGRTVGGASFGRLAGIQAGFVLLLGLYRLAIPTTPPEAVAFIFLLALGVLGGWLFVVSNRLYLRVRVDYGRGYSLDLFGSFVGALATASILIPLAGLARVIESVLILNGMSLVFLLSRPKNL